LTEDGEFARLFLQGMPGEWVKKVEQCLKAAISAGDATEGRVPLHLRGWLAHHLIVMLKIHLLPPTPVVDYGLPPEELVESVVWFVLRGMGLKDDVIARHYNPKAWVLLQR
jgi:hypothetical protein